MRNACKILVGKAEGNRPLKTPRRRWEDNVKMDFRERRGKLRTLGASGSGYGLIIAGFCEVGNELSGSIKGGEFLK
jgi:hypothetical protein